METDMNRYESDKNKKQTITAHRNYKSIKRALEKLNKTDMKLNENLYEPI